MDKETLSNYGWIVILVLILAVMLALATPFGNFIAEGFKATYMGLFDTGNNALGIIIPGSDGDGGSGESGEPGETSNTPIKFYQPYRMSVTYENAFYSVDYVFHEDGSAEIYQYGEEIDGIRLCYGDVVPAGFLTYTEDGIYSEGEMIIEIGPDGSYIGEPGGDEEYRYNLVPTTVKYLQYGETYVNTEELTYMIFQADGSGTTSTGGGTNKLDIPAGSITYQKETFTAFDTVCAVHPEGDKIIMDGLMLEIGCPHIDTEIINAEKFYTGDIHCLDCNQTIKWGHTIACQHLNAEVRNASATYTGDTYCSDCGKLLIQGETICVHANTELRNQTDEYTGDTYCKDCGKLIANGDSLLITFSVGIGGYPDGTYQAIQGMTWEEWINSDYGVGFYITTGEENEDAYNYKDTIFRSKPFNNIKGEWLFGDGEMLFTCGIIMNDYNSWNNYVKKDDVIIADKCYCVSYK